MDDPRWIRLVTIGLILAAVAVGYFLISGRLFTNSTTLTQDVSVVGSPSPSPSVLGQDTATVSPSPTSKSAYNTIAQRAQGGAQTLPNTGFPVVSAGFFSAAAIAIGLGLKKFPN